jgi:hypothetical protein
MLNFPAVSLLGEVIDVRPPPQATNPAIAARLALQAARLKKVVL